MAKVRTNLLSKIALFGFIVGWLYFINTTYYIAPLDEALARYDIWVHQSENSLNSTNDSDRASSIQVQLHSASSSIRVAADKLSSKERKQQLIRLLHLVREAELPSANTSLSPTADYRLEVSDETHKFIAHLSKSNAESDIVVRNLIKLIELYGEPAPPAKVITQLVEE